MGDKQGSFLTNTLTKIDEGEEDEADDDSSPDGISLVDQVQPIQDIGHNVEDKEAKI